jgi:Flp pilus assembly protein TadB
MSEPPPLSGPTVPRDELEAVIEARREVGPSLEPELVDRFVERIERRIDERIRAGTANRSSRHSHEAFVITLVTLGLAIPLIAIAGGTAGLAGILAVCAALVLVNVVVRRS